MTFEIGDRVLVTTGCCICTGKISKFSKQWHPTKGHRMDCVYVKTDKGHDVVCYPNEISLWNDPEPTEGGFSEMFAVANGIPTDFQL
jgi:hypothetical protein